MTSIPAFANKSPGTHVSVCKESKLEKREESGFCLLIGTSLLSPQTKKLKQNTAGLLTKRGQPLWKFTGSCIAETF